MSETPAPAPTSEGIGFWDWLSEAYHTFKQARFSIIVTLLAIPIFLYVDQGTDLVRAIGEGSQYNGVFYTAQEANLYALLIGLLVWSLNSWYWARVTLDMLSPDGVPASSLKRQPLAMLVEHVPRILGVLPLVIFGGACFVVWSSYGTGAPARPKVLLIIDGIVCLLLAALLYIFFILRRNWLEKKGIKSVWKDHRRDKTREPHLEHRVNGVRSLSKGTLFATGLMLFFSSVLFILFLASPVTVPKFLGSAAILAFSASSWICFGSVLVAITITRRIPIITILAIAALGSSLFNDNHAIRTLDDKGDSGSTFPSVLKQWSGQLDKDYPEEYSHTIFVVTAAGGGIRAAYWTATVLGALQEKSIAIQNAARIAGRKAPPDFASRVFAISGVSGGSLGAATFSAMLVESRSANNLTTGAQAMLGEDFLSPALAALLNRDWLQRFLPWKIESWDRGRALEAAWEDSWRSKVDEKTDRFARPINDLYINPSAGWIPLLFLNGTSVEEGCRVISSPVEIDPRGGSQDFVNAKDATALLGDKAIRLSTASHMSARFTYVSPAGRFPNGQHVVDGGYFENSGDTTAWDILQAMKAYPRLVPIVIEISNSPGEADPTDITASAERPPDPATGKPGPTPSQMPLHGLLDDALAPIYVMLDARGARGTYAQTLIRKAGYQVKEFTVASSDVPLPLGWMLSGGAAQEMRDQIGTYDNPRVNPRDAALLTEITNSLVPTR